MKNQALFSSKDKSKKLKCLLQFLFGALRVNIMFMCFVFTESTFSYFKFYIIMFQVLEEDPAEESTSMFFLLLFFFFFFFGGGCVFFFFFLLLLLLLLFFRDFRTPIY